jgi:pimeloyl-ACP methyl ester carboxylesterase
MKQIIFFVNGIATWPGDSKNWNKRAVTWTHLNTSDLRGQLDEYFTTALTVWVHAKDRAENFAELLQQFDGWDIIIVAHSNGCHVALDALRIAHSVKVRKLHLVAGACDGNFARNGLNWMLKKGQVGSVAVYRGGKDWAMRLCSTLGGKALFGIYLGDKPLGLGEPQNVDQFIETDRVKEVFEPAFGHSTWWSPKYFDASMRLILH